MSSFYGNFPTKLYDNNYLTDLSIRLKVKDTWLNNESLYYRYIYKDSDKPEHIALKYYQDETLHWIILLTNSIFDVNYDFPMSDYVFNKYISDKYQDNGGVKTLRISQGGSGYTDGVHENVPLTILNPNDLTKIGTEAFVTVTVTDGSISNISVYRSGSGYDENTLFNISPSDLSGNGECVFSILEFMPGFEYAAITPDPVYRYQKQVKITSSSSTSPQIYNYVIDRDAYENLYDDYPSEPQERVIDEELVIYEVGRRFPEVTLYQREFELNESKRIIRILKKEYVVDARIELLRLMRNS